MLSKRTVLYSALTAFSFGLPGQALAQLEEVIVTARKKSESIQSTPVAVTALTEEMLLEQQVVAIGDLKRTAPNLSIMEGGTGSAALVFVAIRGNAQTAPNAAADPAVGTYIDGIYFARPTGGNLDLFDVQRAEVLRGPQGTLFGRNTTGGALNIYTNQPVGEFEGYIRGEVGNYNHKRIEGVLNVPLDGDQLAARLAVRYNERDGYGDYRGYSDPGGFVWEGLDEEGSKIKENVYARGTLLWAPEDSNFQATLSGWYSNYEDTGQRTEVQGINQAFVAGPFTVGQVLAQIGFNPDTFLAQQKAGDAYWNADNSTTNPVFNDKELREPGSGNETQGFYLNLEAEFGDYQVKSLTSFHETLSTGTVDLDGTPINFLTFASEWDQSQFSQELQIGSTWGDNLDWIAGAYYMQEDSDGISRSRAFGVFGQLFAPGAPVDAITAIGSGTNTENVNTSAGVFIQSNYSFSEELRLTTGLRWTWDNREITRMPNRAEVSIFNPDPAANCLLPEANRDNPNVCKQVEDVDFDYPAWIVSLDYQASDDLFMYAKTSGASMAGGWNVRGLEAPAFDPEDIMDVEVGFKLDMLEGTLRLNTALFYMWADDQQRIVNEFNDGTLTQFVRNASSSESYGAEFELTWLPWEGMTLAANLSFLESEYDDYEVIEGITTGDNAGQSVVVDHSGENAPHAPEMTWSLSATQFVQTSVGELSLHADYAWVDDTYFQDNTVRPGEGAALQQAQREEQGFNALPDYGVFNAMAELTSNDEHWTFTLWGKNLADEEYYTGVSNFYTAFGTASWYWGAPRTYGAAVKYSW
jgi:iron complex outermembrane recepter protein